MKPEYSLAVDIGGTFTDIVLRGSDGRLVVDKTLTTPKSLLDGFFTGVHAVLEKGPAHAPRHQRRGGARDHRGHQRADRAQGSRTAMLVTEGFRDVLSIRNEHRYDMYDPQIEFAATAGAARTDLRVRERILADGEILRRRRTATRSAAHRRALAAGRRESVAICLLNSYCNPANERAAAASCARERAGSVILAVLRGRAADPRISARLDHRDQRLYHADFAALSRALAARLMARVSNEPLIMLWSGGIIGVEVAGRNPVRMIESGPAAGALGRRHYAEVLGADRLMSFDMGGTTAKACLIEERKPLVTGLFEADRKYRFKEGSGMPVTVPSIDMIEIGAGGGSIASVDGLGLLKVGPRKRGRRARPGLLRARRQQPTVTDADLVLGSARRRQLPGRRHATGPGGGAGGDGPGRPAPGHRRAPDRARHFPHRR